MIPIIIPKKVLVNVSFVNKNTISSLLAPTARLIPISLYLSLIKTICIIVIDTKEIINITINIGRDVFIRYCLFMSIFLFTLYEETKLTSSFKYLKL